MIPKSSSLLVLAAAVLAAANPVYRRTVSSLNQAAFQEAQQRDDTATRAFSNIQIKTSDGKCLRIDELSGDFRANLTPIQVVECGTTNGQGWDIITAGKHNDQQGQMLVVSTLTEACLNVDPRRAAGNQVLLFSCGGRADGSGQVTNSQLFAFGGGSGPLSFQPENDAGSCLFVNGNVLDVTNCQNGTATQSFTFGGSAGDSGGSGTGTAVVSAQPTATDTPSSASGVPTSEAFSVPSTSAPSTLVAVTATPPASATPTSVDLNGNGAITSAGSGGQTAPAGNVPTANPTTPVPVSRAGGTLNPSAAAESNEFDSTATRARESVNIQASDGRCLFIDPTAGDFRQNLIPVQLAKCSNEPNQKFDIITKGKHNDGTDGGVLVVSALTNGCISFDGRRQAGDTVTMFACGGRADGSGQTNSAQQFPFKDTSTSMLLAPLSDNGKTCLIAGTDRVQSTQCDGKDDQNFAVVDYVSS